MSREVQALERVLSRAQGMVGRGLRGCSGCAPAGTPGSPRAPEPLGGADSWRSRACGAVM